MDATKYAEFLVGVRNYIINTTTESGLDLSSALDLYSLSVALDGVVGPIPLFLSSGGASS